ncbi:hypothetical protein GOODEAATRI_024252 [Goodea atripinnis]|uniref:Secreted protein n=1 Tax=Goodea atripinnis TaxID=208336 RepID=A0ABV0Q0M4_9TELE
MCITSRYPALARLLMLICAWRGVPFQTAVPGEQNERNLMMNRILLPSISAPFTSPGKLLEDYLHSPLMGRCKRMKRMCREERGSDVKFLITWTK